MIELKCTGCGTKLEIDEASADNKVKCPDCGTLMDVPGTHAAPMAFQCNHCGADLEISVYMAGKMVNCRNCGQAVLVPSFSGGASGGGCFSLVALLGLLLAVGSAWLIM